MNKFFLVATALFLALFLFRVGQTGGLSKPGIDPELENLSSGFIPSRDFLAGKIEEILPQPQAALLAGILLGVKSQLPKDFNNALRRTSTIHIVVVSGQNLSLLIGFLMKLSFLGRRKMTFVSFAVIILYPLLTGLQVPVLRAALMIGLASAAQLLGRERDGVWILLLTGFAMLLYNPNWIFSISFQLSFLATVGVIVVAPELVKKLNRAPEIIRQDLGVSLAAQALTWPVIAANFHQASLIGVVVNTLVLWTISFIMVSGVIALAGVLTSPALGSLLALIPGVLLTYFIYVVSFFDRLPLASIYVGRLSPLVWVGYYILVLGLFLWLKSLKPNEALT
ncbi:ComEC/Rec2 family competence protein [Candidatus Daviesbacteria bacterium]|nr:ComEC/Rec2 family competence protein [Candidatus Daviesbacteria bacterium]